MCATPNASEPSHVPSFATLTTRLHHRRRTLYLLRPSFRKLSKLYSEFPRRNSCCPWLECRSCRRYSIRPEGDESILSCTRQLSRPINAYWIAVDCFEYGQQSRDTTRHGSTRLSVPHRAVFSAASWTIRASRESSLGARSSCRARAPWIKNRSPSPCRPICGVELLYSFSLC